MGFGDRLRAWFRGEPNPTKRGPSKAMDPASRAALRELAAFVEEHEGVEAFIEPATTIYPTTLLLVAGDGQYLRRPIGDRAKGKSFATDNSIPLYDAAKVGYPQRMRDWDKGIKGDSVSLEDLPPWPE